MDFGFEVVAVLFPERVPVPEALAEPVSEASSELVADAVPLLEFDAAVVLEGVAVAEVSSLLLFCRRSRALRAKSDDQFHDADTVVKRRKNVRKVWARLAAFIFETKMTSWFVIRAGCGLRERGGGLVGKGVSEK